MPETESTHEVAEHTDPNGTKTRVERERSETSESVTVEKRGPEVEGEAKQVKPDGR